MSHPNPKFGQVKCARHADAHCYQCYPIETPTTEAASFFEDSLVGRPTVSTMASITPPPLEIYPVGTTTVSTAPVAIQEMESDEHPLVAASTEYAKAVEVHCKAIEFLRDCEKRLEFAKDEVAEASQVKTQAFEKVRSLVKEQS